VTNPRAQLRQPRLAEMVAGILREKILSGELADGSLLAKQEELIQEFNVSKPSVREALRILETEGLITVLRGNTGGAVVHVPQTSSAAYMLGLVLQSKHVELRDVGAALKHIEPICAGLCAERDDRKTAVVPRLREVHEAALAEDDEVRFTELMREFHEETVALCGNQTMIQLVGALETLWSAHERLWAKKQTRDGTFPRPSVRSNSLNVHEQIIAMIEEGKTQEVAELAREHLDGSIFYASSDGQMAVTADVLR
jgi:GntR family transcriptional repressor for pyruvate dehydrogenase complex